jgi:hypothetical protein
MATKKTASKPTATRTTASRSKVSADTVKPKSTGRKTRTVGKSASGLPAGFSVDPVSAPEQAIPHDQIAMRAYFIAERRQQMGWHGDSHSDWADAEAQLKAEALKKPLKKR